VAGGDTRRDMGFHVDCERVGFTIKPGLFARAGRWMIACGDQTDMGLR